MGEQFSRPARSRKVHRSKVHSDGWIPHFAIGFGFAMLLGVGNRWGFRNLDRKGGKGSWMTGFASGFRRWPGSW